MSDTQPSQDVRTGSATRKIQWLGVAIVVAIGLYTAGWFWLASRIEDGAAQAIAQAEAGGTTIGCADRDVRGYPFRLGLHCEATALAGPDGARIEAGAFRSAAQIYEPNRIISELDGPLVVEAPGLAGEARWDLARASTSFGTERLGLGTFSVDDATFRFAPDAAETLAGRLDRLVASVRPNAGALDAALTLDGLDLEPLGGRDVPPASLSIDASLSGAADALAYGAEPIESLRGRDVTIRTLDLALAGGGRVSLTGDVAVDANGLPTGALDLGFTDPAATVALLSDLVPEAAGALALVGQVLEGAGGSVGGVEALLGNVLGGTDEPAATVPEEVERERAEAEDMTRITVTLDGGRARAGFIPLGTVPPLP